MFFLYFITIFALLQIPCVFAPPLIQVFSGAMSRIAVALARTQGLILFHGVGQLKTLSTSLVPFVRCLFDPL